LGSGEASQFGGGSGAGKTVNLTEEKKKKTGNELEKQVIDAKR